jgi:hypothetical protein
LGKDYIPRDGIEILMDLSFVWRIAMPIDAQQFDHPGKLMGE